MIHVPHTCKYCHQWQPHAHRAIASHGTCRSYPQNTFDAEDLTTDTASDFTCPKWSCYPILTPRQPTARPL